MEEIVKKIKILIDEKQVSDVAMKNLQDRQTAMESDLDHLNQEVYCLEATCSMKEATMKRLQYQYAQSQTQTERQLLGSNETKQRIEALSAQIEAEKMQRRKERRAFELQMEELIMKHKWTAEYYTPAKLHREARDMENSKQQLLNEEHATRDKLNTLDKELNSLQLQASTNDVDIFLRSQEAKTAHELMVGENTSVRSTLDELNPWGYERGAIVGREKTLAEEDQAVSGAGGRVPEHSTDGTD